MKGQPGLRACMLARQQRRLGPSTLYSTPFPQILTWEDVPDPVASFKHIWFCSHASVGFGPWQRMVAWCREVQRT